MASRTQINTKLLNAARSACAELFPLMLAEKAHKVHGRFTDAHDRLRKAIKAAEEAIEKEHDEERDGLD